MVSWRNVGADGFNVVTFCSNTSFQSGVIASTPEPSGTIGPWAERL